MCVTVDQRQTLRSQPVGAEAVVFVVFVREVTKQRDFLAEANGSDGVNHLENAVVSGSNFQPLSGSVSRVTPVVVAQDQNLSALQLAGALQTLFPSAIDVEISQDVADVIVLNSGVPPLNDGLVHFINVCERSLGILDNFGVVEVPFNEGRSKTICDYSL